MEWILVSTKKPKLGSMCVIMVPVKKGADEVSIARYIKFNVRRMNYVTEDPDGLYEGFVSRNQVWRKDVLYYFEVPSDPPKIEQIKHIKEQIKALNEELLEITSNEVESNGTE